MASREKKNGGDFVLESRHLVGLFMLLVVIFGVVFTLGYLLGRSQYDTRLRAAVGKPPDADPPAARDGSEIKKQAGRRRDAASAKRVRLGFLSFRRTKDDRRPSATGAKRQSPPRNLRPRQSPPRRPAKPATTAKSSSPANAPLIPKGAIMLQVAAVQSQEDALALAQALQQKKFPAFVITPSADKYYRVQVGPYADTKSATIARQDLEAKGFKSIVKR